MCYKVSSPLPDLAKPPTVQGIKGLHIKQNLEVQRTAGSSRWWFCCDKKDQAAKATHHFRTRECTE